MPQLEVKNLKKEFDLDASGKYILFDDLSFSFNDNETFLSILAPFGTGKTTLLKIIAGIEHPTEGNVYIDNKTIDHPDGRIVYIPEKPSSLPWLNVFDNISMVRKFSVFNFSSNDTNYKGIIKLVGLEGYENYYADKNSAGFRFRISIARAILLNPAFILIDNSLQNFDDTSKFELFEMLRDVAEKTGIKFLTATADVSTAVRLCDRVIILKGQPSEIAGEFIVGEKRDKENLVKLISLLENIFQGDKTSHSIKFII